jgi:PAS domain S-box-containing protein
LLPFTDTLGRSLKLRLILPMFAALLTITAGFAAWDYSHTKTRLLEQTQDEASRYANGLRDALLGAHDVPEMQRLVLSTAIPNPAIDLIMVAAGPDARIVAANRPELLGRTAIELGHPDLTANLRAQRDVAHVQEEARAVDHTAALRFSDGQTLPTTSRLGAVMLHYGLPQIEELARDEAVGSAATMLLLVIVFAAGAFWALERLVLSRLFRLTNAVATFAENRETPELRFGDDEIGELTRHILSTQREVASRELELESIVGAAGDGIIFTDTGGVVIQFNRAAVDIFGYESSEVLGQNVSILMGSPHEHSHDGYIRRYLETGERRVIGRMRETQGRHKDGHAIPLMLSVADVHTATGHVFVAVLRDLSEQRRAEANLKAYATALESATMRAESSAEAKAEFLANMSHEIRTPMTAILGYVDLLMDEHTLARERHSYLNTVKQNGEHLLTLINDILDLSKIEADRVELERTPTDIVEVVGSVIDLLRFKAKEKGIRLWAENDGQVPHQVVTDGTRLRQILVNLVGNAIKFTSLGGVKLRIRYPIESSQIYFDVEDSGIGMAPDRLERIFDAFGQAETSTSRNFGGTGLGLTISRKLARKLGGEIHVTSTESEGSVFSVSVPVGNLQDAEWIDDIGTEIAHRFDHDAPEIAELNPEPVPGGRVLLAEDNPVNQKLIQRFLEREGAEVFVVDDGSQACTAAISAAEDTPFDVVLMDMIMPTMDGYEATAFLRENGYTGVIVALTANAMEGDREKCLRAGCDDYLTKPIQHEEFRRVLRSYVLEPAQN